MKKELTNIIYDIPLWALDIQMPRHLRRHLDAFWGMSFFHVCSTSKFMSPNFCSAMFFGVFWSTGFTLCWFRRLYFLMWTTGRWPVYRNVSFWRPFASRLCWFCWGTKRTIGVWSPSASKEKPFLQKPVSGGICIGLLPKHWKTSGFREG